MLLHFLKKKLKVRKKRRKKERKPLLERSKYIFLRLIKEKAIIISTYLTYNQKEKLIKFVERM